MTRITVRFPDEVYTRLKEAKKEHLSLNSMIIQAVEDSLSSPAVLLGKTQIDIERLNNDRKST